MSASFDLYLIRHAQSANNAVPDSQRVEDPGLTTIGHEQKNHLANRFREVEVTHLLTSGFLRAVETMRPVADVLGIAPTIWTDLHEVGGCFAGWNADNTEGKPGMNRDTLASQFSEFELPDDIDEDGWWKSKPRETYQQAQLRAAQQSKRLLEHFAGSQATVACVIHADLKALMLECLLQDNYQPYAYEDLVNTGVSLLKCTESGVSAVSVNDASHLPDNLVTS